MTNKTLGLLLSLVVLLMLSVVFNLNDSGDDDEMTGRLLFPSLEERILSLESVKITADNETVNLDNKENTWVVRERKAYQADFQSLYPLIEGLAEARILERKTSRAENLVHLGLDDQSVRHIELKSGTDTFDLLVGDQPSGRKGRYVRFPDDNQAWLIDRELELKDSPAEWLQPVIIDIDSALVIGARVESPDGEQLEVVRDEPSGDLKLVSLPSGKKLKYPGITNELGRALTNVRLKDIVIDETIDWQDAWKAEFTLSSGYRINVRTINLDDRYLLAVDVRDKDRSVEPEAQEVSGQDTDADSDAQGAVEENADQPRDEDLYAAYSGLFEYVFVVEEHVFGEFAIRVSDWTDAD